MTVLKDTATNKLIIVDDLSEWADELQSGEYEYMWEQDEDTNEETYPRTFNDINIYIYSPDWRK